MLTSGLASNYNKYIQTTTNEENMMSKYDAAEGLFDDYLGEKYGIITIEGIEYSPSTILRTLDPVAYEAAVEEFGENN